MKVQDCMCQDICCIKPETKIGEAAKLMSEHHVGCLPVCDNNNSICGIVTDRDLVLRCIACDKDVKQTPISDIMTCDVSTCKKTDDITNAESKMGQKQIRRFPVCDDNNRVVGMLTLGDLANNDNKIGKEQVCDTLENICDCEGKQNNM